MFIILLSLSVRKGGRLSSLVTVAKVEVDEEQDSAQAVPVARSDPVTATDLSPTPWRIPRTQ